MAATQNPIYLPPPHPHLHFIGCLTLTCPETNKAAPNYPLLANEEGASQF